jgi:hypothetical protein
MGATPSNADRQLAELLQWCAAVVGPCGLLSDHRRAHPGERSAVSRLRTACGYAYLKTYRDATLWASEAHAYQCWAPAFGDYAPRLLAVRAQQPLAVLMGELPGRLLEEVRLDLPHERAAWRAAGQALAGLHELASGEWFGPCRQDGTCAGTPVYDARQYVRLEFEDLLERGQRGGFLGPDELDVVRAACRMLPAFAGERPRPCHRDYCPANWLVSQHGDWAGVIDFEFARWDVRAADFTRYPDWDWISRPDLVAAFFEGYGRNFTPAEEQQRLVEHVLYALGAIVWGCENAYFGFAAEGRQALRHLAGLVAR